MQGKDNPSTCNAGVNVGVLSFSIWVVEQEGMSCPEVSCLQQGQDEEADGFSTGLSAKDKSFAIRVHKDSAHEVQRYWMTGIPAPIKIIRRKRNRAVRMCGYLFIQR